MSEEKMSKQIFTGVVGGLTLFVLTSIATYIFGLPLLVYETKLTNPMLFNVGIKDGKPFQRTKYATYEIELLNAWFGQIEDLSVYVHIPGANIVSPTVLPESFPIKEVAISHKDARKFEVKYLNSYDPLHLRIKVGEQNGHTPIEKVTVEAKAKGVLSMSVGWFILGSVLLTVASILAVLAVAALVILRIVGWI